MKKWTYDDGRCRRIIFGMCVNTEFLAELVSRQRPLRFGNICDELAKICVQYFRMHKKAPGGEIWSLVEESGNNEVFQFLKEFEFDHEATDDYQNTQRLLDIAYNFFFDHTWKYVVRKVDRLIENNEREKVLDALSEIIVEDSREEHPVNLLHDKERYDSLFYRKDHVSLIEYPGDLGGFFGTTLRRDGFIAFIGSEKTGKSFWLMDICYQAVKNRKKTLFLEIADLSYEDVIERFTERISGRPTSRTSRSFPLKIKYPTMIMDQENFITEERTFADPLTSQEGWRAIEKFTLQSVKSKYPYFLFQCFPRFNVMDIRLYVENIIRRFSFEPDVIVIDYADLLEPPAKIQEFRHQQDKIWRELRAIAMDRHCLVVTATQGSRKSYDHEWILKSDITEDKRKLAHVTGAIGINRTETDEAKGRFRLNWVVLRSQNKPRRICTAECLDLSNPAVLSKWWDE